MAQLLHGRIAHEAGRDEEAKEKLRRRRPRHGIPARVGTGGWVAGRSAARPDLRGDRRALLHACRRGLGRRRRASGAPRRPGAASTGDTSRQRAEPPSPSAQHRTGWRRASGCSGGSSDGAPRRLTSRIPASHPARDFDRQVAALRDVARRLDDRRQAPLESALRQERDRLESGGWSKPPPPTGRWITGRRVRPGRHPWLPRRHGSRSCWSPSTARCRRSRWPKRQVSASTGRAPERGLCGRPGSRGSRCVAPRSAGWLTSPPRPTVSRELRSRREVSADWSGRRRLVLVPPADLLTAPWGLLPVFADALLTVSPSATLWASAVAVGAARSHRARYRAGLSTGETEVTTCRRSTPALRR